MDELSTRHRKALLGLRGECDYEDHHKGGDENFILRSALPVGVGEGTLDDLLRLGLIVSGPSRWRDEACFRITAAGREALK